MQHKISFSEQSSVIKLFSFNILIIALILILCIGFAAQVVSARSISDNDFSYIAGVLKLPGVTDKELRDVLNREVEPGINIGDQIAAVLAQLNFGESLINGSYYTRYVDYFNNVIDNNTGLNFWMKWGKSQFIKSIIKVGLKSSEASTLYSVVNMFKSVIAISDVWSKVVTAHNDAYLKEYIAGMKSNGGNDEDAWDWLEPGIIGNKQEIHSYFISVWKAYAYAEDSYKTVFKIRKYIYSLIRPPQPVIKQNPLSGPAGTSFQQSGSGFSFDGTATLHFLKPDGVEYPAQTIQLDSNGSFSINYESSPVKNAGIYKWWAIDDVSDKKSNEISYEVKIHKFGPEIGQSPYGGSPGTTFKQWGIGFTPDGSVTLHFEKPDGTEYPTQSLRVNSSGYFSTSYTASNDKKAGVYNWWALDDSSGISSKQTISYRIMPDTSGTIYINGHTVIGSETWYSGKTYIVQGQINIVPEATLNIQTGAVIQMGSGVGISVSGTLTASGAKFTARDKLKPWGGINFSGQGSSQSHVDGCVLEYAGSGTIININNSSPAIQGNTISGSTYGIYIDKMSLPLVTGNTITKNQYAIYINGGGGQYRNNTISQNTTYGIHVLYSANNPVFSGNTYSGNARGDFDVSGLILGNAEWREHGKVIYCIHSLTISQWSRLTISPGQVVKFSGTGSGLTVYGIL